MARKRVRNEIVIERNIVENILMIIKDFIREHRKVFLYALSAVFVLFILVIALSVYIDKTTTANQIKFEKILKDYQQALEKNDSDKVKKTIIDLKKLAEESYFGFAHDMSYYTMASIYFNNKQYKEAKDNYLKYADTASSSIFTELALVKAAVAEDYLGNYDEALNIYKKFEKDNSKSILLAQVFYYMGNVYESKNDYMNAKLYYNNVITSKPQSVFAKKAKKRIFLLGLQVK